jgi:hypothetical protein
MSGMNLKAKGIALTSVLTKKFPFIKNVTVNISEKQISGLIACDINLYCDYDLLSDYTDGSGLKYPKTTLSIMFLDGDNEVESEIRRTIREVNKMVPPDIYNGKIFIYEKLNDKY